MPVFELSDDLVFPPVHYAEPDGLLAVGGDLGVDRLVLAYQSGIFPWYSEGYPILWWSPDPRLVLIPDEFRPGRRLERVVKSGRFRVTVDTAFQHVIGCCASVPRPGQRGTWITSEMIDAYCDLHDAGYAHSIEVWSGDEMVGGLYGVALGRCFYGESMFSHQSNASKIALAKLVSLASTAPFDMIDCQQTTAHLVRMGAREVRRAIFMRMLEAAGVRAGSPMKWG